MNPDPKIFIYCVMGVAAFFVLTIVCMILYSGGTIINPSLTAYSFPGNFFSDLGRTKTFTGDSNSPVFIIFSIAAMYAGLATTVFFYFFPRLFDSSDNRLAINLAMITGMTAGLCFAGIGLTPWDILYPFHILFVKLGFSLFLISSICSSIAMYRHPEYPNFYVTIYGLFIIILCAYLYILFYGPKDQTSPYDMSFQVISQKILLYSQMVCMSVQAVGAYRCSKKKTFAV